MPSGTVETRAIVENAKVVYRKRGGRGLPDGAATVRVGSALRRAAMLSA